VRTQLIHGRDARDRSAQSVELEEDALIDGCTRWQALLRMVLPLIAQAWRGPRVKRAFYGHNQNESVCGRSRHNRPVDWERAGTGQRTVRRA
jgi:hypothetical protein